MEPATTLGLLVALGGPIVIARIGERAQPGPRRVLWFLVAQTCLSALVVLVLVLAIFVEHLPWRSLGLANPGLRSIALGLVLAAFFVYGYGPVAYWTLSKLRLRGFEQGLIKLEGLPVWYLVLAVLVSGTAEEFLYRAYAFERLAAATGSFWFAAALPLLFFALAHFPMWGWPPALTMLVSGGILTVWYAWHRDLAANVVTHCVTDLFGIVIAPLVWKRTRRTDA